MLITLLKKDLLRAFRGVFGMAMSFVAPILITLIIAFAFGGLAGGGSSQPEIQAVDTAVVNLDQGMQGFSGGELLIQFLQDEELSDLIRVHHAATEEEALALVGAGEAASAVVIPAGFSQAVAGGGPQAEVRITSDPALTVGPTIIQAVISQFIDGFNGSAVAGKAAESYATQRGESLPPGASAQIRQAYGAWLQQSFEGGGSSGLALAEPPAPSGRESTAADRIFGVVLAGQMVFFGFWTASNNTLSILEEHEDGTLGRLFTTPVRRATVLASKSCLVALFLVIQVTVLLLFSRLILGIHWGSLPGVLLASLGLVFSASGFGVFVISLLRDTRQSGAVLGGVLTVFGMLSGLFTPGFSEAPAILDFGALITPQGWAMRLWKAAAAGAPMNEYVLPLLVCVVIGITLFAAGYLRFSRRFA